MASANQIKALLSSYIDGDEARFYATAMQLAAAEAKKGHGKVADEIRKLIDQARTSNSLLPSRRSPTPINRPNKELADLLSVSYPTVQLSDMTFSDNLIGSLQRLLDEQRNIEKLKAHGLDPRRKLLFTGPPGCGKTMAASAIAGELKMPLFVVRLDGLITKFMGESISKLRVIFDSILNTRAVYLFDEFDSIGANRKFTNDVGEIKRVLNSFLMFIEQDQSNSVIIAATNNPLSLDSALFRRFDELLEFDFPTASMIEDYLKKRLWKSKFPLSQMKELLEASSGLSFADIAIACDDAVKNSVLKNTKAIQIEDLKKTLKERAIFHARYSAK